MKESKIIYNPNMSVRDNAIHNKVSIAAIRWYIRVNNIDRKLDSSIYKYSTICKFKKENPNLSIKEISEIMHYSQNTIRKYLKLGQIYIKANSDKLSSFDLSNSKRVIKSVSIKQDEILQNIIKLYLSYNTFDCDLTSSTLGFWKRIQKPAYLFDLYPQIEGVQSLEQAKQLPSNIFSSIIFDLPFLIRNNRPNTSLICQRFNSFINIEDLYTAYNTMLDLSYNLLNVKGILVVKTMDITCSGKSHWVSNYVLNKASEIGLKHIDTFILVIVAQHIVDTFMLP